MGTLHHLRVVDRISQDLVSCGIPSLLDWRNVLSSAFSDTVAPVTVYLEAVRSQRPS